MGLELSGVVLEARDKSLLNKEVCALVPGGAYAEYCVVDSRLLLNVPFSSQDPQRFIKSAGINENLFTVWKNLFRKRELRKKKTMLFHGGSGGIGLTAVQLAKQLGKSRIIVTAGSPEKCRKCLLYGADKAVNYKDETLPWEKEVGKVDVVLDVVGGVTLFSSFKLCLEIFAEKLVCSGTWWDSHSAWISGWRGCK